MKQFFFGILTGLIIPIVSVFLWFNAIAAPKLVNGLAFEGKKLAISRTPFGLPVPQDYANKIEISGTLVIPDPLKKKYPVLSENTFLSINDKFEDYSITLPHGNFVLDANGRFFFDLYEDNQNLKKLASAGKPFHLSIVFCDNLNQDCSPFTTPALRTLKMFTLSPEEVQAKAANIGNVVVSEGFQKIEKCLSDSPTISGEINVVGSFQKNFYKDTKDYFVLVSPSRLFIDPLTETNRHPLSVVPVEFRDGSFHFSYTRNGSLKFINQYALFFAACRPNEPAETCQKRLAAFRFTAPSQGLQWDGERVVKLLPEDFIQANCNSQPKKYYATWFQFQEKPFLIPEISSAELPSIFPEGFLD